MFGQRRSKTYVNVKKSPKKKICDYKNIDGKQVCFEFKTIAKPKIDNFMNFFKREQGVPTSFR